MLIMVATVLFVDAVSCWSWWSLCSLWLSCHDGHGGHNRLGGFAVQIWSWRPLFFSWMLCHAGHGGHCALCGCRVMIVMVVIDVLMVALCRDGHGGHCCLGWHFQAWTAIRLVSALMVMVVVRVSRLLVSPPNTCMRENSETYTTPDFRQRFCHIQRSHHSMSKNTEPLEATLLQQLYRITSKPVTLISERPDTEMPRRLLKSRTPHLGMAPS